MRLLIWRRYAIQTFTSDLRGAGTDANVTCVIFGDKGQTPVLVLSNHKNNFEVWQQASNSDNGCQAFGSILIVANGRVAHAPVMTCSVPAVSTFC
jgi:hypothetical protein